MEGSSDLLISSLQSKIEKLVYLHRKSVEDNLKLNSALQSLQLTLQEQQQQIELLTEKMQKESENGVNTGGVWVKVGELEQLMREIDRCMNLVRYQERNAEER